MGDRGTLYCTVAAAGVLMCGALELTAQQSLRESERSPLLALAILGTTLAVAVVRRVPWLALVLAWLVPICQIVTTTPFVLTQAALAAITFGVARWGTFAAIWAGALSVPAASLAAVALVDRSVDWDDHLFVSVSERLFVAIFDVLGLRSPVGLVVVLMALLGTPWLAGLTLRTSERARANLIRAARDRARAEDTARVRDAQTRLARDVHDVVGHSLAVILAQAESGQYLPDDDPVALKSALATIATSARTSLRNVRDVLTATRDTADDLQALIDNLRTSGHEVMSEQEGVPGNLDQKQRTAAYRVLQEMLTNAIRHGVRGGALIVKRRWSAEALEIEVRNAVASEGSSSPNRGSGMDGMRQRLAEVGGILSAGMHGNVFVATARIPLS